MSQITNTNENSQTETIPLFVIVIVVIFLVMGYKGTQQLAFSERITHDTCYITSLKFDSINADNWHYTDQTSDTIAIRDRSVTHHYHFLHDTITKVRTEIQLGSVPGEVRVVKTKVERYTPWYARFFAFISFLALVLWIGRGVVKFYLCNP